MTTTLEQLRAGALAGAQRLTLNGGLSEFPAEIMTLADTLEILDLSGNALTRLPDDLPRLRKLRILFCSDNHFTELPEVLGRCERLEMMAFKANRIRRVGAAALPARLRWLILTDNEIEALPPEIGRCHRLQKLALAGNRLRSLPAEMAACTRLELLRISANRLSALPDWLLALPRLSWLAHAGNPFGAAREHAALTEAPMKALPWSTLDLQEQLGEGASGVIHRAALRHGEAGQSSAMVALKVFKGQVTSDGWPHSELAAAMQAGAHPNLIPVLGRLSEHPAQAHGLLMQLIAPSFRSLAGPPSLDSCTRDIYAPQARFAPAQLLRLAGGIASALAHLHRQGIAHGDLYGHNILHDDAGQAYLGDFGAASFFDPADRPMAQALQHLEVRAFGCLLEELLDRCDAAPAAERSLATLRELQQACLAEPPSDRPLFDAIEQCLSALPAIRSDRPCVPA